MDTRSETVASGDMYERLRAEGVADSFEPVPDKLVAEATRMLDGAPLASFSKRFRYLVGKSKVARGNRLANARRLAAATDPIVMVQR